MNKHNQIIGVIGGMGPQASCELYRLMITEARHRYGARDNDEYPEVVIDSVPVPDFLADTKKMEEAASILEDRVGRLTAYGASIVTLACNTACILNDRLQKKTDKPLLSVIDEVVGTVLGKSTKEKYSCISLYVWQSALSISRLTASCSGAQNCLSSFHLIIGYPSIIHFRSSQTHS